MSRHIPVIEPDVRQLSQLQTGSTGFSLRMTIQRFSSCEKEIISKGKRNADLYFQSYYASAVAERPSVSMREQEIRVSA